MFILHEIHLVNKAEHVGRRAEFFERFDDGAVSVEVLLDFAGFDIKDVDQDCDVRENGFALRGEVGFREGRLSVMLLEVAYP
jgi:hypothetical protein